MGQLDSIKLVLSNKNDMVILLGVKLLGGVGRFRGVPRRVESARLLEDS